MFQYIVLNYYHPTFNIGMQDVRNVWLLEDPLVKLQPHLHRGALAYRLPKTGKRISYRQLKPGLVKRRLELAIPVTLLPF